MASSQLLATCSPVIIARATQLLVRKAPCTFFVHNQPMMFTNNPNSFICSYAVPMVIWDTESDIHACMAIAI